MLVLGAGGGVGLAAVQIAKVLGAKVVAVTQVRTVVWLLCCCDTCAHGCLVALLLLDN